MITAVYNLISSTLYIILSHLSPCLTISLCRAGQYFSHPVVSILCHVFSSFGMSSCLPVCCPSLSFAVGPCSFSQKPIVFAISHRKMWLRSRLMQWPYHFRILFSRKVSTCVTCASFIYDVIQPGLPSCSSQHQHFSLI